MSILLKVLYIGGIVLKIRKISTPKLAISIIAEKNAATVFEPVTQHGSILWNDEEDVMHTKVNAHESYDVTG